MISYYVHAREPGAAAARATTRDLSTPHQHPGGLRGGPAQRHLRGRTPSPHATQSLHAPGPTCITTLSSFGATETFFDVAALRTSHDIAWDDRCAREWLNW